MTRKPREFGYTLVQHSGYGYAGKPGFQQAVETRGLERLSERNLVQRVGGVLYADYGAAEDAAMELNYPHPFKGPMDIYPGFQGSFSDKMIDGLRIAIPLKVPTQAPENQPF